MNEIENNKNDEIPSFQHEYDFIRSVFIDRFVWNCEYFKNIYAPTYIESNLFEYGMMGLFKDEKYGFMLLPCVGQSQNLDIYGKPVEYKCTGDGYSKIVSKDDIVLLINKGIGDAPFLAAERHARRVFEISKYIYIYAQALTDKDVLGPEETKIYIAGIDPQKLESFVWDREDLREEIFLDLGLKPLKLNQLENWMNPTTCNFYSCEIMRQKFVEAAKKRFNFDISFKRQYEYKGQFPRSYSQTNTTKLSLGVKITS
ncbi:hypothetical protein [Bartonella taylorii]|uniref:hypothetical protein n=1 Tax=Bartonella taylorii TaxID=33046 RepID=UPI001ABA95A2|nr:hypothetical protein [Bartonella taylorii]